MNKVHIVYVQTEGAKCSYHCRTFLDVEIDDRVLVMFSSGEMKLGRVTNVKEEDNENIMVWLVEKINTEKIKKNIRIGEQLGKLDKSMMARYEDFVRKEGFEDLAGRDPKMQELFTEYKSLLEELGNGDV